MTSIIMFKHFVKIHIVYARSVDMHRVYEVLQFQSNAFILPKVLQYNFNQM